MRIEAPRGTLDVLPADQPPRERIVAATDEIASRFGYRRIVTPSFEHTELFARAAGAGSDVVQKEMYTFVDRGERSLTLRPEATAGICRAYVEHGLHRQAQPVKLFTTGPMFRFAAPQRGRYREFWQIDFEAVGSSDPALDVELVLSFVELERLLEIEGVRLELNSIGCRACRPAYVERLETFLEEHWSKLDDDARAKAATSPLRVFDTKSDAVRAVLAAAPTIGESLCQACSEHFASVRALLDACGVAYDVVPTLVRGLDYYTRTVWEFVNDRLGAAQATICAGGRYDELVEEIGGAPTPGVGWAAGIERLAMSMPPSPPPEGVELFFAFDEGVDRTAGLAAMARLRTAGRRCDAEYAGRSLKGQLTQAQRLGASVVVIVRPDRVTVRRRGAGDVDLATLDEAVETL